MKDIGLVMRTVDYRGDHAADYSEVIRVPLTMTVFELLTIVEIKSSYCKAVIEIKPEGNVPVMQTEEEAKL